MQVHLNSWPCASSLSGRTQDWLSLSPAGFLFRALAINGSLLPVAQTGSDSQGQGSPGTPFNLPVSYVPGLQPSPDPRFCAGSGSSVMFPCSLHGLCCFPCVPLTRQFPICRSSPLTSRRILRANGRQLPPAGWDLLQQASSISTSLIGICHCGPLMHITVPLTPSKTLGRLWSSRLAQTITGSGACALL